MMTWNVVEHALLRAIGPLIVVAIAFHLARIAYYKLLTTPAKVVNAPRLDRQHLVLAYGSTVLVVAVLSIIGASNWGTHVEDAEPLHGGGERVTDEEHSDAHRVKHGVETFFFILPLALYGVWRGHDQARGDEARESWRQLYVEMAAKHGSE